MADPTPTPVKPPAPGTPAVVARPRMSLGQLATRLGLAVLVLGGATWYFLQPKPKTPGEKLNDALALLDKGRLVEAREAAKKLEKQERDPQFPGGVEYILGQVAFRQALDGLELGQRPQLISAATYLKDAERRALAPDRRADWAWALGQTDFLLGNVSAARPLLEETERTSESHQLDAAWTLIEIYLDPSQRSVQMLNEALELSDKLQANPKWNASKAEATQLQRAEILLNLKRMPETEVCLKAIPENSPNTAMKQVLQARVHLAENHFPEAIELLDQVANDRRTEPVAARHASYLLGVATLGHAEAVEKSTLDPVQKERRRVEYRDRALTHFQRSADRFEETHEGIAARLALADLFRDNGQMEKALQEYGDTLRSVRKPEDFRNRWISAEQFRERLFQAWDSWVRKEFFAEAIALSEMMTPLVPREQAYELAARANQRWAETISTQMTQNESLSLDERNEARRNHWRQSATAYVRLANARKGVVSYPETLWIAADQFYLAHDYEASLNLMDRFLDTMPTAMLASALMRRGQILMDLDRIGEAMKNFERVSREFPTDPTVYTARYLIGVCHRERNDHLAAEKQWREILASPELTPAAQEWRESLWQLGKLLAESAASSKRTAESTTVSSPAAIDDAYKTALRSGEEAIARLDEFLARYPNSERISEVRYQLAKTLQLTADIDLRALGQSETDDARKQIRLRMQARLERALDHLRQLRDLLQDRQQHKNLDDTGLVLLKATYFEIPHTFFSLQRDQEAIAAYGAAVNRYPQDVEVLTAFLQMARGFTRLGKPVEARGMLEQARVMLQQKQIPDAGFNVPSTNLTRTEWEEWLNRARQLYH